MNSKSTPVQLGIIGGIVSIIVATIQLLFFSNQMANGGFGIAQILGLLSFVFLLVLMFKAASDMKASNSGFLTLKEGLKTSYVVAIVASVLSFLFTLLSKFVLFPNIYKKIQEQAIDKAIDKMEAQGLSEEMIDQSIGMTAKMMDMSIWIALPMMLIVYFIVSLIIAAIVQKKRPA